MICYVIKNKETNEYWSEVGFTKFLYNAWFFESEYSAIQYSLGGNWENCKIIKVKIKEID